jgi:large subunit ribosomal protein L18
MIHKPSRTKARKKRHYKMRRYLSGTANRPRLAVFRSNKHIYAQIIDDTVGRTLASASTMEKALIEATALKVTSDIEAAKIVGTSVAKKALEKGINTVVFDRGGCIFHGKIKALADAAREAGLTF